jgi:carbon-monoxide dehydrogenase medium subunit
VRAGTVEEACALLAGHGAGAKLLAGGQSLIPMMNLGLVEPEVVVDVGRVGGLEGIVEEDGHVRIGALTRHRTLERDPAVAAHLPLLQAAVRRVGNVRVRARGTLGGSLAHNDPAAELPLAMAVLEAEVTVSGPGRSRTIPWGDFPITYFTTALADDEVLTSVLVPKPGPGWGFGFHEVVRRAGDFAIVAAAAAVRMRDGVIEEARVGLAGVADRPVRRTGYEEAVRGRSPQEAMAGSEIVAEGLEPPSDTFASADYRRRIAPVLASRAILDACGEASG